VIHPAAAGQAYADAATAYDTDAVLVMSELDPALNDAPIKADFDMRKFNPRYFLINGQAHPDTSPIATDGGNTVLLRYVNAGVLYHSMGVLGAGQSVIALDGSPLDQVRHFTAETFGPGQTADALVTAPGTVADPQLLSVYDANLLLHNSNTGGGGGMFTSIEVAGSGDGTDTTGPVTSAAGHDGSDLTATVDDSNRGGGTVTAAEFYLDDVSGAATAMAAVDGSFDTATEQVTAPVPVTSGEHVLYGRGQDADGHWGPFSSVLVTGGDEGGPTTKSPVLTPRLTTQPNVGGVAIAATGDDSDSGNSNVTAAE
jgi:hypothetical protein